MPDTDFTAAECRVFTRYLIGCLPDAYIMRKYAQAFEPDYPLGDAVIPGFDALLLKLAVLHPLLTRTTDIYSRFFRPIKRVCFWIVAYDKLYLSARKLLGFLSVDKCLQI